MRRYDVAPFEGFHPEIGLLLASPQDSTRTWRDNLGSPPVEAIAWQPAPEFHSIGALILHMIDAEAYWFETFAAGRRRPAGESKLLLTAETRVLSARWPTPPREPIEWYTELHDRIRSRAVSALASLDAGRVRDGKDWSVSMRWVVAHVVEHDAYHGGQAVLLHELWKRTRKTV